MKQNSYVLYVNTTSFKYCSLKKKMDELLKNYKDSILQRKKRIDLRVEFKKHSLNLLDSYENLKRILEQGKQSREGRMIVLSAGNR